jgi:hypothetical protein
LRSCPPTQSLEVKFDFDRGIMGLRPTKVMKNGSCSATTLSGNTTLPFVISTGAQRSGEICGPFLEMFFRQSGDSTYCLSKEVPEQSIEGFRILPEGSMAHTWQAKYCSAPKMLIVKRIEIIQIQSVSP